MLCRKGLIRNSYTFTYYVTARTKISLANLRVESRNYPNLNFAQSCLSLYILSTGLVRQLQMTALKIKIYFFHDDKCLTTGERSEAKRSLKMIRRAERRETEIKQEMRKREREKRYFFYNVNPYKNIYLNVCKYF